MSKRTLFIHIGTWKTGSTTIQFYLNRFKKELREENLIYLSGNEKIVTDDRIIRKFKEVNNDYINESHKKLKEILENYNDPKATFVTSAEEFSGDPFTGYKNGHLVSEMLYQITKNLNLDIKIIVYLRRQDDFIESLYTHSIYLGRSHTFDEFLATFDNHSFNWKNIIDAFSHRFGKENIIVKRYHKKYLPHQNSLIQGFGEIIGSKLLAEFDQTSSKNKGYSRDMLEVIRILNKEFGPEEKKVRKLFKASDDRRTFEKFAFFSTSERMQFYSNFEESNDYIAANFLSSSEKQLFPLPDERNNPPDYPGLTLEAVTLNFAKVVLHIDEESKRLNRETEKNFRNKFLRYRLRDYLSSLLSRFPKMKAVLKQFRS